VATIPADTDLGALSKEVGEANTPHRSIAPPGLAVVLFARLDEGTAKKAEEALAKVKGVNAKGTAADVKRGEISVQLTGDEKVTMDALLKSLKDAGIEASSARSSAKKPSGATSP
jgi:hypothetical protein